MHANLTRMDAAMAPGDLAAAVEMLHAARRITVLGFRNSAVLAAYARALLVQLRDDVELAPHAGMTLAESLAGLGPQDVLLAFGFRRRPAVLAAALEAAREGGARTILIADPTATLSATLAQVALFCPSRSAGSFDSYAAAMSLTSHLAARLAERGGAAVVARLRRIEELHERIDAAGPLAPGED